MNKTIYIFIFQIILSSHLLASEPILAILNNVNSNETQQFNIGNYDFNCTPYGVIGLSDIHARSKPDSICRKKIDTLYVENPRLKHYSHLNLYLKQRYHIEFKNNSCVLYANGEMTLSELLLKNGLAILEKKFKDEEFAYSFKRAQLTAKLNNKGLWGSNIHTACISELSK